MNSAECTHSIELENLESGEIVKHSILLIKGQINTIHNTNSGAFVNKCTAQNILLKIRVQLSPDVGNDSQNSLRWMQLEGKTARNKKFKLLCDLRQCEDLVDSNVSVIPLLLELSFCNCIQSWQLTYLVCRSSDYYLQPLYIACKGAADFEVNIEEACEKIELNLRLVQCVYAEQLRATGFSRRTFVLGGTCQVFHSELTCVEAWQRTENELWQYFAKELLNSPIWNSHIGVKFIAFIGCTKYDGVAVFNSSDFSYANIRRHLKAHAALGGGGLALFGTAYFYAWPRYFNEIIECFQSDRKVDISQLPDDSNYRRTYGGVYATTLGAVVHEIGHSFDLGHTSDGVMGSGFDYINRIFTVDNLTEYLPNRIIQQDALEPQSTRTARPRYTLLKKTSNNFLNKYHEQKASDGFHFSHNCTIILAYHWWFNGRSKSINETATPAITYEPDNGHVVCAELEHPLRSVEVRCKLNSLVKYWYDIQARADSEKVCRFQLPTEALIALQQNHYLFVITVTGHIKRLCEH